METSGDVCATSSSSSKDNFVFTLLFCPTGEYASCRDFPTDQAPSGVANSNDPPSESFGEFVTLSNSGDNASCEPFSHAEVSPSCNRVCSPSDGSKSSRNELLSSKVPSPPCAGSGEGVTDLTNESSSDDMSHAAP